MLELSFTVALSAELPIFSTRRRYVPRIILISRKIATSSLPFPPIPQHSTFFHESKADASYTFYVS